MLETNSGAALIRKAFDRKKKDFRGFSLRWTASQLDISHVYLSHIIRGLRPIPVNIVEPLCAILDLDPETRSKIYIEALRSQGFNPPSKSEKGYQSKETWNLVPLKDFDLISRWEPMAILMLTLTDSYDGTSNFIADRLNLAKALVVQIMEMLYKKGYLTYKNNKLVASDSFIEFQTGSSREQLYQYHRSVMAKVWQIHETKKDTESRDSRHITSAVVTCSKKDLPRLKMKMAEFLKEFVEDAASSKPEEVYQVAVQFFPLSEQITSKKP